MSDESDIDVMNCVARKGKRSSRIEDSDSSSDSPFEQRKKRKRVLRVASDPENGGSDSDSPLEKPTSRARVPRVVSDVDDSCDESGESQWDDDKVNHDDYDEGTGEEEEEDDDDDENASEEYSSTGSEESESSSYSDWESLDETEDTGVSSLQSCATATVDSHETKVCDSEPSSSKAAPSAAYMSDSSDGQSEKCPICLRNFTTQEVGTPDSCDHSFCVDCLQEWSKNVNTCPVDRRMFTVILVRRCLEGKVIRRVPVEAPRQQNEDDVQEDPTYCEVCGECDREDRMLLCDGCDLGYHLECLDPPMDTVPLEEWFCPDCTFSNSVHLAEEVDIQDGELMALLEDAPVWGLPPLRPRVSRLLPRTRQSERVRATMMTRQREGEQQRDIAQPSTSSGIDSLEADSNTSASSIRRRLLTNTTRTAHKRRKTTKRKTTRKRNKKRKTTGTRKSKMTTSSAKNGLNEVSKRRHKKRRKIKRKKRKTTYHKVRRAARIAALQSVKGRLAEHLGVCPPRRPGQTIPDVRPRMSTCIDFQRSRAGIPTLDLFGQREQLDYFSSGSDHEGGGDFGGSVSFMARPRTSAARAARSVMKRKQVFPSANHSVSTIHSASGNVLSDTGDRHSDAASCDFIGSILNSQAIWHSKKSVVTIKHDGSLHIRSNGESGTPRRNTDNSGLSNSAVSRSEEGLTVRTDDRLSRISSSDAPVNISEAGSSASGHVTQAPMYPGRSGGGSARPPSGGSFQQFGGNRYSSSPSYHGYQSGRGYSNFPPPSSFDSRGTRSGYSNYMSSGPPPPFRSAPLRFRVIPRYPIRRPLMPPVRPQLHQQQVQQIPPSNVEEFQPKSDSSDSQKLHSARPEDEDEIDIYSDIEVGGGSGSGGRGGGGSEPDDGDRSVELGYEALPPPPVPPAVLMGMGGDTMSDEEAGSDTELVIDDNVVPSSPPDSSDRYDPEEAINKPEIPESEKYDPAEPSNDTDEEDEAAAKTSVRAPYPGPDNCSAASSSHLIAHSSSNSSASYLHSPTYGDSSVLGSDAKLSASGVQEVFKDCLTGSSSIVSRELGVIVDEPSQRHSSAEDEEEGEECPNFSIYSATSMDIARRTGDDGDGDDIPLPKVSTDTELAADAKIDSDGETDDNCAVDDRDENSNLSVDERSVSRGGECDTAGHGEEKLKPDVEPEEDDMSNKQPGIPGGDDGRCENYKELTAADRIQEPAVVGVKKLSLVEEIFGSDDNDSVIGGAVPAVSAPCVVTVPQTAVTPLGLEGLDTETISETEEAINFEDDLSHGEGFMTTEEDGEIPSIKKKKKKKNRKASVGGSAGEEAATTKDHSLQDIIDYEEGEIVDDRPKQHEAVKKDKKIEKREKTKYEKDMQKNTDENFDITAKSKVVSSEEEKKKKKKKSGGDKSRTSKERAVLSSSENKDKSKDKAGKADDAGIAWKKLSKSSKERNYRDAKSKPDVELPKGKEAGKKKETAGKDGTGKKEKKKKEKRKDMERYDVRKVVTDRKRRDAFGRDLSRERSCTKSRSRSPGRSYDRSRGRSRSVSRSRITRSKGRSPLKSRIRSRSRSRLESRSRSRIRSRSRSKTRTKVKSKDRLRKSRSKEKQRVRGSRSRSRGRRSRSRSCSRSRNRSRLMSRSRSSVRSRERRDRSREQRGSQRCRYQDRRSWSHSWTPSWSRSGSLSCSSYTRSHTPTPRRYTRSYSHSFSRSWSRERHKRIPVIEKKSGAISKTAKKLTVIVPNTKDDSERHRKKEKKKKESKKNKDSITAAEKRKKRKEKSPAPSKEVFTSGDNILVSVNFKCNKSAGNKDASTSSGAIAVAAKDPSKRKLHDGSFELDRESTKKLKKDKSNKEKASPHQKNGGVAGDKSTVYPGEKKSKKGAQKAGNKASRVATLINKKPVAIIDLDQSPFHEQTPSPRDLIVLSDSEEECVTKEGDRDREELTDSLNNRRSIRPSSCSPKSSKQSTAPSSAMAHTRESPSPPMNAVGSYLVTSTGPKTPPEPQIKFSIAAKPQLRSISNPLGEDEEDIADEGGLDDMDQRIEEELDRGLGEMLHKGPNTPPEPRGPTTPCSPPTSPDAYDPFDPTKSGTPSPVGASASMDGLPSPVHTPTEQLIQHNVIGQESPMVSDLEELASKSLEARVITPTLASAEEGADQSSQSPERSKLSVRGDTTVASSPSIVPETASLPPPVSSDNEMSEPSDMAEGSEKSKQISMSVPAAGPSVTLTDPSTAESPEHSIPVVITSQQQSIQATPVKPQLFPITNVKQVTAQQPITSTPTHSTVSAPVFPTLTPANIASILCTPPPPLGRMAMFNTSAMAVPQIMIHHQQQQQQQQQQQPQAPPQHHLIGSPVVVQQRPLPTIPRTTPEKLSLPSVKLPPIRSSAVQNGEQTQGSQKQPQDTTTDVVDMDLESPYSPGSSEGDDLFDPPTDVKSSGTTTSFTAMSNERNRTLLQPAKNASKLPPPLAVMLHKSPSKPPANQDKFDAIFGLSPMHAGKTTPSRATGRVAPKTHHVKGTKARQGRHDKFKSSKKEIVIKMDEDQLQILDDLPSSAVELQVKDKFLKKLNRQERVVEEVKLSLKPHYTKKHITKEEYKEILRRSVPKICHNRSGEINPIKISSLVEAYVKKYRYVKKKNAVTGKAKINRTMWS